MERALIDQYANGGDKLRQAIRGLTDEDLKCFPVPGTWSIQQIVLHLLDSDLVFADRMKRIIAQENPKLMGFDEAKFAENLFYHDQPAADAAEVFDLNRKLFAKVLRRLPDIAFQRFGTHSERGKMTLAQLVKAAVDHLEHHLKFAHDKRAKMGKEMW